MCVTLVIYRQLPKGYFYTAVKYLKSFHMFDVPCIDHAFFLKKIDQQMDFDVWMQFYYLVITFINQSAFVCIFKKLYLKRFCCHVIVDYIKCM